MNTLKEKINQINERLNNVKTSTLVILFILISIFRNFEDCKKGFMDGWREGNKTSINKQK